MSNSFQLISGNGILTRQMGDVWIIEIDPTFSSLASPAAPRLPNKPALLSYAGSHDSLPNSGSWSVDTDTNEDGVQITIQTGTRYDPEGDRVIYGFTRDLTFNTTGQLVAVSPERRIVIDTPEACE